MAVPKSITKVSKDGNLTYINSIDKAAYTMTELSRGALKECAKVLRKRAKNAAPDETGNLKKCIATWVKGRKDGLPVLHIGVYGSKKAKEKGLKNPYYAGWMEHGTKNSPAANNGRGYLKVSVLDSREDIRRIQSKYLSAIEDPKAGSFDEGEEIGDD